MPTDELLSVSDLTVRFGGVTAVIGASIRIRPGESCALIGPNGAGKTTLFDAVSGLNRPARGTVSYLGTDITARSALWRSQHGIRRTFQRQQTFPGLTVEDNVLVALEATDSRPFSDVLGRPGRRRSEALRRERARQLLDDVGLYAYRDEPAYKLPLGRARLLELARAVAGTPRLLMLDEPTSGMEAVDVERLSGLLERLMSQHECAVLLVEHDVNFAMRHAGHVYVIHLGQVIAEGTPDEIQADPRVIEVYLGDSAVSPGTVLEESAS